MASGGYPDSYDTGYEIHGLDDVPGDITVFHAGTAINDKTLVTSGGRVLGVTATADSLKLAAARAYEGVACIRFDKAHFRTDIGKY